MGIRPRPSVLIIAGSASDGAAGIQADIRTIASFGTHPACAITAVTSQNTLEIQSVHLIPPKIIVEQINSVVSDLDVLAVKIGMLGNAKAALAVSRLLRKLSLQNVVFDPVMSAQSDGSSLAARGALAGFKSVIKISEVITPNASEATLLSGITVSDLNSAAEAGRMILGFGAHAVVIKGVREGESAVDLLVNSSGITEFRKTWKNAKGTHGGGCVFSSALAACLALGNKTEKATRLASEFASRAISSSYPLGSGIYAVEPSPRKAY